jgi:hypothetical protein
MVRVHRWISIVWKILTYENSFRVVLNHYFGADLELLEDESFYSTIDKPYKFTNVTDMVDGN